MTFYKKKQRYPDLLLILWPPESSALAQTPLMFRTNSWIFRDLASVEMGQAGTTWGSTHHDYSRLHTCVNQSASDNQTQQQVHPREGASIENTPLGTYPWPRDSRWPSVLVPILSSRNHPFSRTFAVQGIIFHLYASNSSLTFVHISDFPVHPLKDGWVKSEGGSPAPGSWRA